MPPARYRCAACGNLTRFDVTVTRRTRAFHHYTLGGELTVEDEEVAGRDGGGGGLPLVRVVPGGRDARRRPAGNGELTPAPEKLLRPAIEAAVAVARAGEEDTPAVPAPPALRPFLQFAKLPARAIVAAQRAVDGDDEFRARVAESVSEDDVGRAGWLWLTRPPGWDADLESLAHGLAEAGEAQAERRAENEARRRLAGAEAATQRAEAAAAAAQAESARAAAALAEERRARRAAAQEAEDLARRLEQAAGRARPGPGRAGPGAGGGDPGASSGRPSSSRRSRSCAARRRHRHRRRRRSPSRSSHRRPRDSSRRRCAGPPVPCSQAAEAAAGMAASLRQAAEALGGYSPARDRHPGSGTDARPRPAAPALRAAPPSPCRRACSTTPSRPPTTSSGCRASPSSSTATTPRSSAGTSSRSPSSAGGWSTP